MHELASSPHAARRAPTAALRFAGCTGCGLVRNRAFRPGLADYGPGYLNTQRASATYLAHEDGVVDLVTRLVRERSGALLEIGSGDGTVLRALHERTGRAAVGFDPAGPGQGEPGDALRLIDAAFDAAGVSAACGGAPVAAVCARHVLEHVPDPVGLLRAAHAALADGTPLVLEVPDLAWIARHGAFYDFFHEHCCLFDAGTIRTTLARAGFRVDRVSRSFGGQYLLVVATRSSAELAESRIASSAERAADRVRRFERFADRILLGRRRVVAALAEVNLPVMVWGAGAKGVSFLNQFDPDHVRCAGAIDAHPDKQRRYVPACGHPIWAPANLRRASRRAIVVMNPNYLDEVTARLDQLGVSAVPHLVTTLRRRASV